MLNRAQIIGRLGQDPEVRFMPSGEAVCNFLIATSEKWKDKQTGEVKEETTWHRVTAFGRQAEIVGEYLKRGSLVFIEGKMTQRKYQDKDGSEKVSHEIRMQDMKMLGGREGGSGAPEQRQTPASGGYQTPQYGTGGTPTQRPAQRPAPAARPAPSGFDDMDDDIPF